MTKRIKVEDLRFVNSPALQSYSAVGEKFMLWVYFGQKRCGEILEVRDTTLRNRHHHQSDMAQVGENDRVREDVFGVLRVRTNTILRRRYRISCSGPAPKTTETQPKPPIQFHNHLLDLRECFSTPFRNSSTSYYRANDHISYNQTPSKSSPGPGEPIPFHAQIQSCIPISELKHNVFITPIADTKMSSCHKLLPNRSA